MRGLTIDQMGAMYWTLKDILPAAWCEPLHLPGLRGFWANSFDESATWYDQSGIPTQNNLTATGCTTSDIGIATSWPGVLAPYMQLDGTNDYFSINDNASLSITGDITVGAWVWFDDFDPSYQGVVNKGRTSDNTLSYHMDANSSGQPRFLVSDDGTTNGGHYNIRTWSSAISAASWHFVCGRFDASSSLSLKVDDAAWSTTTSSIVASINDSARPLRIGEANETASYRLDGRIAQVWLCAYHVSDELIDALFKCQALDFGVAFS